MQIPLEIAFRNMEPSPALEARIRKLAAGLEKFSPQIIHCHVIVESPHRHQHQGRLFDVALRVTVPGGEIVIGRGDEASHAHEDVYVALRDAFKAARRRLQDHERQRRRQVKLHTAPSQGRVCEMDRERKFGRIETDDGRLIYFHRNSVLGSSFDELPIGAPVRFVEEPGDLGPQASTVHVLSHAHARPVS
jgi:ribosome-associated translation inhibitor RaiA/cold shock CspA family protein